MMEANMADLSITMPEELMNKISKLANSASVAPKMIRAAQDVVAPEVKRRLSASIKNKEDSTGDLLDSITETAPKLDKNGIWRGYISFPGKGENGTPNGRKALSKEYGTLKEVATPFIRPAKAAKEAEAKEAMQNVFNQEVNG
jgi:hypothetical protein